MRTTFGVVLMIGLCLWPQLSRGQSFCSSQSQGWRPVAYQHLTIDAVTPQSLDLRALPAAATNLAMALVSVEDATIRFGFTVAPTATDGHEIAPGERFFLCGRAMLEQWKAIRTSQGSANAQVRISLFAPY